MDTARFPEIAKAVGAQRGGKYIKRIPKPGGGYRYVYAEPLGGAAVEMRQIKKETTDLFSPATPQGKHVEASRASLRLADKHVKQGKPKLAYSKLMEANRQANIATGIVRDHIESAFRNKTISLDQKHKVEDHFYSKTKKWLGDHQDKHNAIHSKIREITPPRERAHLTRGPVEQPQAKKN
jgi:hypothetical protein